MKKINLNLDKSIGDVLSPEELKNIGSMAPGSGGIDWGSDWSGLDPKEPWFVCGCTFLDTKGGTTHLAVPVRQEPGEPDCDGICSVECGFINEHPDMNENGCTRGTGEIIFSTRE